MKFYGTYSNKTPLLACQINGREADLARITGAAFDTTAAMCYFPGFYPFLPSVYDDIFIVFPDAELDGSALQLIKAEKQRYKNYEKDLLDPKFKFKVTPYEHQRKSLVHFLYLLRCGLLLGCGLGKSKVAIDGLRYLKEPALILCPAQLIDNWIKEFSIHSFDGEFTIETLDDTTKQKKLDKLVQGVKSDILISGYETASRYAEDIYKAFDYKVIIADESSKIKNFNSQRTKAALFLSKKAYRRLILSGTAVLNSPVDLYPQLQFIAPALNKEKNYWHFRNKFLEFSPWNKHVVIGYKHMDVLNQRVNSVAKRYKREDCLDLPERIEITRGYKLSEEQIKDYVNLTEGLILEDTNTSQISHTITNLTALEKMTQICGGFLNIGQKDPNICDDCMSSMICIDQKIKPYTKLCSKVQKAPDNKVRVYKNNPKLDACMGLCEEIMEDPTNKVIIWAKHIWELEELQRSFSSAEIAYVSLPPNAKDIIGAVDAFEKDPDKKILLAQIARGIGFTANSANYVIYYTFDFSLENYLQSIDRNYRINQKRKVTVYYLIGEGTIEVKVLQALREKEDVKETLLNNLDCIKCSKSITCFTEGRQKWDPGCILNSHKRRTVITA